MSEWRRTERQQKCLRSNLRHANPLPLAWTPLSFRALPTLRPPTSSHRIDPKHFHPRSPATCTFSGFVSACESKDDIPFHPPPVCLLCGGSSSDMTDIFRRFCSCHRQDRAACLRSAGGPFDFIVGTDVVFAERLVEPLLETLHSMAGEETVVWLCLQVLPSLCFGEASSCPSPLSLATLLAPRVHPRRCGISSLSVVHRSFRSLPVHNGVRGLCQSKSQTFLGGESVWPPHATMLCTQCQKACAVPEG